MKRWKSSDLGKIVAIGLVGAIASCASPPPAPVAPPSRSSRKAEPVEPASVQSAVVDAHNAMRAKAGLPSVRENSLLDASAKAHAEEMAERRKMSHRGSDGSSPFDRIQAAGYSFSAAGENVAFGFDDVESVMTGWMNSRGHRRNILGNFSEIGVGRAIGNDGASYWCVTFGTQNRRFLQGSLHP